MDTKIGKLRNIVPIHRRQIVKKYTAAQARNSFILQAALGNKLEKLEPLTLAQIIEQWIEPLV